MLDKVLHVLASALVFALFVPGVLVTLGGRYKVFVHALLFALTHHVVARLVDSVVSTGKGLYGEGGKGIRKM
jgi:hypothetical protein|uniref:Uncharacterized protein n=1 Tax=viral metagenome TaxID=1070528 RepID=A0A6C0JIH3_9ZZZZ